MEKVKPIELIRIPEAAKIYGCSRQNLYQLIDKGKLKAYEMYGLKLIDRGEVERLRDELKPRGTPRKTMQTGW